MSTAKINKVEELFRKQSGVMWTHEVLSQGIHRRTLYAMRDMGLLERLGRGVYNPPLGNLDLVAVAKRVPEGVICLISALAYHGITTQVPHEVYLAISRVTRYPQIEYPPVRSYRFSEAAFKAGVEEYEIDNAPVRINSPEKTIADCFKYRNKLGLDTAVEALKLYRERKKLRVDKILEYAAICRVVNVIKPYLEATL